jgi:hypothetical protein
MSLGDTSNGTTDLNTMCRGLDIRMASSLVCFEESCFAQGTLHGIRKRRCETLTDGALLPCFAFRRTAQRRSLSAGVRAAVKIEFGWQLRKRQQRNNRIV